MLDLLIDFCRELLHRPRPRRARQDGGEYTVVLARRAAAARAQARRVQIARQDEHRRLAAATVQDALRRRAVVRER